MSDGLRRHGSGKKGRCPRSRQRKHYLPPVAVHLSADERERFYAYAYSGRSGYMNPNALLRSMIRALLSSLAPHSSP